MKPPKVMTLKYIQILLLLNNGEDQYKRMKLTPMNNAPRNEASVPNLDTPPETPLGTSLNVRIEYVLPLDKTPISLAHVSELHEAIDMIAATMNNSLDE